MAYHFFSDSEFAGPNAKDLIRFWDRSPRQLRTEPRKYTPTFEALELVHELGLIEKAVETDAHEISKFWNQYYTGTDWKFNCNANDVREWMNTGFILIIKERSSRRSIIATFVCHIISGIYCGKSVSKAGLLDGLVVHPRFRGQGLASHLLAHMDKHVYSNPELRDAILLWFREHNYAVNSLLQTPIALFEYMYINLATIPIRPQKATRPSQELVESIINSIYIKNATKFTLSARNSKSKSIYWYTVNSAIIGIADTHRISDSGLVIWEVIFASNMNAPYFENLQESIEIAALNLPCQKGVLFASNCKTRGNMGYANKPWIVGRSGYLSMHVYNWMPPEFLNGDIFFPHGCI
jgi:GNAT superfamily N-acetyltransferase